MEYGNQHAPSLDNQHGKESDALLHLHVTALLAILREWQQYPALRDLGTAITQFKHTISDSTYELCQPEAGDDCVTFSKSYLFGEIDQIAASLTRERATYYIDRLIRSVVTTRTNAINDIDLNRWKAYEDIYTDSLWLVGRRDTSGIHNSGYWGNFIPQIPQQMMRRYTKQGEWVLDTFAGSATTLIEGQRLGRNTIGIELQAQMVDYGNQLVTAEQNTYGVTIKSIQGDSAIIDYTALLKQYQQTMVQLVIMHPPYFDIIKFSDDPHDLSNAQSVDTFLTMIGRVVTNAASVLAKGRYLIVVIGDKYAKGDWIPLGFQTMNAVMQRGFSLKSIIVKNFDDTAGKRNQKELWRYRALAGGFYVFKHEYIFVFKKQ